MQIVSQVICSLTDLRDAINKKEIPENGKRDEESKLLRKSLTLINSKKVKDLKK